MSIGLAAVVIGLLFTFFKVKPGETSIRNSPTLECISDDELRSKVDTTVILKQALANAREVQKNKFLSTLTGRRLWGIDISKYQTNINWNLMVRKNKPDFVFVKVTEGTTIVDRMYRSHKRNLEKHNILHGAYHFMSFSSSGRRQAYKFIRQAGLKRGNMVPVLDVEYTKSRMPNRAKVIREIRNFCKVIERHYGVKPIIYTHSHLYTTYLRGNFNDNPLWICDYGKYPRYKWSIWQHTGKGRIYGLSGRVDKNVMKSDKKTLKTLLML